MVDSVREKTVVGEAVRGIYDREGFGEARRSGGVSGGDGANGGRVRRVGGGTSALGEGCGGCGEGVGVGVGVTGQGAGARNGRVWGSGRKILGRGWNRRAKVGVGR